MSYDLMVFEKTAAPQNRKDFMKWYEAQTEWTEDHEYDDPAITSKNLRNWFMEIIKKFPQMNGPYALDDEEIGEMENESYLTDYSVGKDVIYVAFAWSLAEEAFETVIKLAMEHDVGFFNVSSDEGEIIFPDKKAIIFKHFNPIIYEILNIIWIAVLALSAYFLLIYPAAIGILVLICLFRLLFDAVIGRKLRDLSGKFICGNSDFHIISLFKNIHLYYSDIVEIKKEWYTKRMSFGLVGGSQYNAGQYSIFTKNGKRYIFRISENEEKNYLKKINKLNKQIYKTNSLGVHFNTKKLRKRLSSKENEIKFEQEKPTTKYTLETVIEKLLEKSNMELNDTTIEK